MANNKVVCVASTAALIGCCIFSPNTTDGVIKTDNDYGYYYTTKDFGTESSSIVEYNLPYKQRDNKSKLEMEAEFLFGPMREATKEEQDDVKKYIESIAVPTGLNFWD